jgi:hypothetical protein
MEIPLRLKYRCKKSKGRHMGGEHPDKHGPKRRSKRGPKTYVYGSRVLLVKSNGKKVMVDGEV